jgi:hypothetical protein
MNKQELAEQIAGILYKNKTDEADEGSWIESKDFYKVAVAIVEAMGVQQEKEQPSLQSGKLSAEEVLYKHVLADADNHVMGTTLTVTVPPLEELKNNQQFQMHVAAMKEYAQQVYATAAPTKAVEAMDAPAKEGMKWVKASERLPEKGKQVFWNRHEEYPVWGRYSQDGGFHDLVTIDSSGEEEAEPINYDWEWLDESAPAVEAISVPAQQPSLEEKKEDLLTSDNNSSNTACDAPFKDNNSNQQ